MQKTDSYANTKAGTQGLSAFCEHKNVCCRKKFENALTLALNCAIILVC